MLTGFQKAREITNYFASAYLLTVSSLCLFARCLPAKPFTDTVIQFDIYEERPHGTMIGDVFQRIQSVTHSSSNFSNFVIVANQPAVSTLFQIDQDRGHLLTKRKLDRDSICQQDALCCPSAVSDENRHSGSNSLRNGAQQITLYRTLDECQIVFRVLYNVVTGSSDKNQTVSVNDAEYFGERGYVTIVLNVIDLNDNAPKFLLPVATNIPNTGQPENNRLRTLATSPLPTVELWIDETTEPDVCFELPVAFDEDSTPYSVTEYHLSKVSQSEVFQRFDSSERHVETFDSELPFVLMQSSCSGVEWDENRLGFTSDPFSTTLDGVSSGGKLPNSRIVPHVKLVSKLDREVRDEYWMKVLAMDSSETGLSVSDKLKDSKQEQGVWNTIHSLRHTGTLLVRVRILDANDNPPEIASNLEIQINEDVAIGTVIDTLSGTDRDAGDNGRLTYRIDPESLGMRQQNFPFKIHPISGAITVSQALDADQSRSESVSRQIRFNVITSDAGKPVPKSALTVVTVSIANVNDETPQIKVVDLQSQTNPPRPLVKENLPPGQLVAFVTATDRDSGIYGSVRCQVDNQKFQLEIINPIVPMVISDTAASKALESHANKHNNMLEFKLTTTVSLDHELAAYEVVEIICTDQAIEASAIRTGRSRILVTVIDENDNSPKFDRDELYLRINENEAINELITTFNATDADQVQRLPSRQWADYHLLNRERFSAPDFRAEDYRSVQKIRYSIDSVGNGYFHLDSLTGALYSKVRFDREEQDVVNFTVTATDGGIPPRNASIHVVVSVVDKNDNPPKFDQDLYEFELFENTSVGATIFELKATDRDVGFNAEIVYQMEDFQGTAQRQFHLDTSSGKFSLKSKLDREKQSRYAFKVYAADRGIPKLSCVSAVIVRVLDINDNAPKFVYPTQKNHTIYASVYTSPGVPLVKLTAVDPDEGRNAQLSFFLEDTTEHAEIFVLDEGSGELSLAATNEPEKLEGKYGLVLRVQDAGTPSLSCTANINIVLNQNAKLFGPHSVQPSLVGKQLQLESFGKDQSSRQARFESIISSSSAYQETNAKGRNMKEKTPDLSGKWDPQTVRYSANDAYVKPEDGKKDAAQPFNYLSSEKALVAVICLIVLSALVAFVFLIAITLIRRKASALQLRSIPPSGAAVSAAGIPRISARIANTYNSKARQLNCTSDKVMSARYAKPPMTTTTAWVVGDLKQYPTLSRSTLNYSGLEAYRTLCHTPADCLTLQMRAGDHDSNSGKIESGEIMSVHNPDSHLGHKGTVGDLSGSQHADQPAIHFQPQFGYVTYTCQPLNSPESFELLPPNIQIDSPFLHSNCFEERADDYSRESNEMRETLSYGNTKDFQESRNLQVNSMLNTRVKFVETPESLAPIQDSRQNMTKHQRFSCTADPGTQSASIDVFAQSTTKTPVI